METEDQRAAMESAVPAAVGDASPATATETVPIAAPAVAIPMNGPAEPIPASRATVVEKDKDPDAFDPELLKQDVDEDEEKQMTTWETIKDFFKTKGRAKELKEAAKVPFARLFQYADLTDRVLMGVGLIAALAAGGAQIYVAVGIGDVTQPLIQYSPICNSQETYDAWQLANPNFPLPPRNQCDYDYLINGIIYGVTQFGVLGVISFVSTFLFNWTWQRSGERQTKRIRERYLEALLKQETAYFDGKDAGEMITRISGDANLIQEGISEKVPSIVSYVTVFIGGFVVAFVRGWKMALVILSVFPLLMGAGALMGTLLSKATTEGQESYSKAGAVAQEALQSVRTVQAFGREETEAKKYDKELDKALNKGILNGFIQGIGLGTLFALLYCIQGLAFWYGSTLIENGTYDAAKVLSVFFALMFGSFVIANVAPSLAALGTAQGAAYEIYAAIDRESEIDGLYDKGIQVDKLRGDFVFKDVDFFYPSRPDSQILKSYNLSIKSGTMVALVGGSGSGKSTVIKLINRFYDPQGGEVLVDGRSIKDYNVHSLRSKIGIVSQEPVLFDMTIRENILMGLENTSSYSKEKLAQMVEDACEMANAKEFVEALPKSYDTHIGVGMLSGGQKQRIAIARAIISNPSVLLLDEATSALDTASERIVQAALDKASQSRTTIVVAHRLSTIKNATTIVVMDQGTIIEMGNHDELVAKNGVYAGMVQAQALRSKIESGRRGSRSIARHATSGSLAPEVGQTDFVRRVSNAFLHAAPLLATHSTEAAVLASQTDAVAHSAPVSNDVGASGGFITTDVEDDDEDAEETEDNEEHELASEDASNAAASKPGTEVVVPMNGQADNIEMTATNGRKKITRSKTAQSAVELRKQEQDEKERKQKEFEAEMKKKPAPWGRLIKLNGPEWKLLILGTIGAILNGALQPVFALVFSNITNVFSPFNTNLRSEANFWSGMFAVLGAVQLVAWVLQIGFFTTSGEILTRRIRGDYFKAILRQEVGWYDDEANSSGVLTARLATEATEIKGLTGQLLGSMFQVTVSLTAGIAIAFAYNWQIALVVLATVPIIIAASAIDMSIQAGNTGVAKELYIASTSIATEAVSEIRTVQGLAKERFWLDSYRSALVAPHERILRSTWSKSFAAGFSQGGFFLIWAIAYYAAGRFVGNGTATALSVQTSMFAIIFSALAVGQASMFAPNILKAKIACYSVFGTMDRTTRVDASSPSGKSTDSPKGEFDFQNVFFNYPTRPDAAVLRGVDVQGNSNQTVALVGPSGSGKSTVIQLLERFYDVMSGSATVEAIEIRDWNVRRLREDMALVQQEPVLLGGTIRDNIAYGKPSHLPHPTMEEIEAAARMANAHDFVSRLPQGYNTKVGAKGSLLSGGQKQRIAIARALIRNPKILLLDEATSALDTASERIVQDALDKARTGRTTVTIAHRLSTIQNADQIYVFRLGKVIEQGKHQELLEKGGLYNELVQQQSLTSKAVEEAKAQ